MYWSDRIDFLGKILREVFKDRLGNTCSGGHKYHWSSLQDKEQISWGDVRAILLIYSLKKWVWNCYWWLNHGRVLKMSIQELAPHFIWDCEVKDSLMYQELQTKPSDLCEFARSGHNWLCLCLPETAFFVRAFVRIAHKQNYYFAQFKIMALVEIMFAWIHYWKNIFQAKLHVAVTCKQGRGQYQDNVLILELLSKKKKKKNESLQSCR